MYRCTTSSVRCDPKIPPVAPLEALAVFVSLHGANSSRRSPRHTTVRFNEIYIGPLLNPWGIERFGQQTLLVVLCEAIKDFTIFMELRKNLRIRKNNFKKISLFYDIESGWSVTW